MLFSIMLSAATSYPGDRYLVPFCGMTGGRLGAQDRGMKPQLPRFQTAPHRLFGEVAATHGWAATWRLVVLLCADAVTQLPALALMYGALKYAANVF